tara:strand:+ start:4327 stop:6168 length:1842 start_codon:yes stop_codon:yes gene_type:complete
MLAKNMSYTFLYRSPRMYQHKRFKSQTKRVSGNRYKRHVVVCSNEEIINEEEIKEKIDKNNTDFTTFVKKIEHNKVKDVYIEPPSNTLIYSEVNGGIVIYDKTNIVMTEKLMENMIDHNVKIHIESNTVDSTNNFFSMLFPLVFFSFFYVLFSRILMNNGSNPMLGNNNSFEFKEDIETDVTFEDIAGIDEIIYEVNEYVDFLKNPNKYKLAGANIPAGCLLYGEPGTGKTMIAKAIAGEAGVPFLSCSASQFIELFVGLGASRIRKLFENARKNTPCILFIDEIDAIGKKRGNSSIAGGNDEREQTLNQLLTEMDGFSTNDGVVVIAATNRLDSLDNALIRPGRFDRKIKVPLPNIEARRKIASVYMKDRPFSDDVDDIMIATKTIGCSGAEIKNIINEAAISSVRNQNSTIQPDDITYAVEKVSIGLSRNITYSDEQKRRIAIHELGHAFIGATMTDFDNIDKISILPIGDAGGVTTFIPDESTLNLYTFEYLINKIKVALGGHACEELFYGESKVSTGAISDFQQVTNIAYSLIRDYGFSKKIGKLSINDKIISQETKYNIDKEVKILVEKCYEEVYKTLTNNKEKINSIIDVLIEKETLNEKEFNKLII